LNSHHVSETNKEVRVVVHVTWFEEQYQVDWGTDY